MHWFTLPYFDMKYDESTSNVHWYQKDVSIYKKEYALYLKGMPCTMVTEPYIGTLAPLFLLIPW